MSRDNETKPGEKLIVIVDSELNGLIPGFIKEWKEEILSMRIALEENNFETIRKLGHNMRGIGTACGLETVSEMGEELEKAAKAQALPMIQEILDRLSFYLQRIQIVYE